MGCFKVSQFLSLFNVIKTKLLSVSPTVTKDVKRGGGEERGRQKAEGENRIIGVNEGKCTGESGENREWVSEEVALQLRKIVITDYHNI